MKEKMDSKKILLPEGVSSRKIKTYYEKTGTKINPLGLNIVP
jgi:hypothetical protein